MGRGMTVAVSMEYEYVFANFAKKGMRNEGWVMSDELQVSPTATIFICRQSRQASEASDYNIMPRSGVIS